MQITAHRFNNELLFSVPLRVQIVILRVIIGKGWVPSTLCRTRSASWCLRAFWELERSAKRP